MTIIATDKKSVVIGLGKTGFSVACYLASKGEQVVVMDTRDEPPYAQQLREAYPAIPIFAGDFDVDLLLSCDEVVVSPGVSLKTPALQKVIKAGKSVIGDVDLFARAEQGQVIAITGSNGKSTVTTLVGEMAKACGRNVAIGGNIGTPVLDLIGQGFDLFVLELSSFQLETLNNLKGHVATVLNVTEDHMDRYDSFAEYHQAKHRIFRHCEAAVFNADDPLTQPLLSDSVKQVGYSLKRSDLKRFSIQCDEQGNEYICFGLEQWLPVSELKIRGRHNLLNAVAALALGFAAGLEKDGMLTALRSFSGLRHRCQWIRALDGVDYINDSKGTNIGATQAALSGLGNEQLKNIVLIAGGIAKGADFSTLAPDVEKYCRAVVLIGDAADQMKQSFAANDCTEVDTLQQAVKTAREMARKGDTVLLSPACSSFDMFKGFEDRGEQFVQLVEALS